jgi:hypothetical protein
MFNEGWLNQQQKVEFQKEIETLMAMEQFARYFKLPFKGFNERPFLSNNSIKIPDRVAIDGENVVVMDYKTGTKRSDDSYQLKQYMNELGKMGYKDIKGYLVYTESKTLEAV